MPFPVLIGSMLLSLLLRVAASRRWYPWSNRVGNCVSGCITRRRLQCFCGFGL